MRRIRLIVTVLTTVFVVGFLFYWYEYRPTAIRKNCNEKAIENAQRLYKKRAEEDSFSYKKEKAEEGWYLKQDYEDYYRKCLRSEGLEK